MAAKNKSIDGARLIKMVEDKVPRPEIMKKLNIKTSNQLTVAYARAQMKRERSLRLKVGVEVQLLVVLMRLRLENVGVLLFRNQWQRILGSL